MGFMKFLGRIGDNLSQTEKETPEGNREELRRLKALDIYRNNYYVKAILDIGESLEKITFGVKFLPNADSVYESFNISDKNEIMIATVRSKDVAGGLFSKERIAITDKALYCHAIFKGNVRFPLEDLSKYIITISEDGRIVNLVNEENSYGIMRRIMALSSKDKAERSVVFVIKAIQRAIIEHTAYGRQDRERLCDWIIKKTEEETETGALSNNTIAMLESMLESDPEQKEKLGGCMLRYSVRSCDLDKIQSCVDKISELFSNREQAKKIFTEELDRFSAEIQDYKVNYPKEYIKKSYGNIRKALAAENVEDEAQKEFINKAKQGIAQLLQIRNDMTVNLLESNDNSMLEYRIDSRNRPELFQSACAYKNCRMSEVCEQIQNGIEITGEKMRWTDGFGFDALHYSIFLGREDVAEQIIKEMDKSHTPLVNVPDEIRNLYDYGIIASFLKRENLAVRLMDFSPEIRPLLSSQSSLKLLLKLKEGALQLAKNNLSTQERIYRQARHSSEYDQSKVEEYRDTIDLLKERILAFEEEVNDLRVDLAEITGEIETYKHYLQSRYAEEANRLKDTKDSLEWLFCYIYRHPEEYFSLLRQGIFEGEILYFHDIGYFVPQDLIQKMKMSQMEFEEARQDADNRRREERKEEKEKREQHQNKTQREKKQEKEKVHFTKPHGEHWFSDAAYSDINILRKEYHKLVTQYHPDNNPDGVGAFLEIQEERSKILERLQRAA